MYTYIKVAIFPPSLKSDCYLLLLGIVVAVRKEKLVSSPHDNLTKIYIPLASLPAVCVVYGTVFVYLPI